MLSLYSFIHFLKYEVYCNNLSNLHSTFTSYLALLVWTDFRLVFICLSWSIYFEDSWDISQVEITFSYTKYQLVFCLAIIGFFGGGRAISVLQGYSEWIKKTICLFGMNVNCNLMKANWDWEILKYIDSLLQNISEHLE